MHLEVPSVEILERIQIQREPARNDSAAAGQHLGHGFDLQLELCTEEARGCGPAAAGWQWLYSRPCRRVSRAALCEASDGDEQVQVRWKWYTNRI